MENNEIKEILLDLKREQKERDKILFDLKKGQEELFKGQEKLFQEIDKLSLSVARIEAEHGEKLGILLDVVTGHTKKFDSVNERIKNCEKRLDNHDDKFYILKSAVQAY